MVDALCVDILCLGCLWGSRLLREPGIMWAAHLCCTGICRYERNTKAWLSSGVSGCAVMCTCTNRRSKMLACAEKQRPRYAPTQQQLVVLISMRYRYCLRLHLYRTNRIFPLPDLLVHPGGWILRTHLCTKISDSRSQIVGSRLGQRNVSSNIPHSYATCHNQSIKRVHAIINRCAFVS